MVIPIIIIIKKFRFVTFLPTLILRIECDGAYKHQQLWMYENESNRINDRIVNIAQPHIRPIVRGKAGKPVEFERGGRCEAKQLVQPRCWSQTFCQLH